MGKPAQPVVETGRASRVTQHPRWDVTQIHQRCVGFWWRRVRRGIAGAAITANLLWHSEATKEQLPWHYLARKPTQLMLEERQAGRERGRRRASPSVCLCMRVSVCVCVCVHGTLKRQPPGKIPNKFLSKKQQWVILHNFAPQPRFVYELLTFSWPLLLCLLNTKTSGGW